MRTFEWAIEDIVAAYPDLALEESAAMAIVLADVSPLPCEFLVRIDGFDLADLDEEKEFILRLTWNARTTAQATRVEKTKQRTPIVEGAAVALGFLLIAHLIPDGKPAGVIRGEGPDYWMPRVRYAVEISGTEATRLMKRRHREKRRQLLANWRGWNGYVILCCFSPSHRVI
jgi:hypothetical protein